MDTVAGVITILFDTGIIAVTILNAMETMKCYRRVEIWHKESIAGLLVNQGEIFSHVWVEVLSNPKRFCQIWVSSSLL